MPYFSVGNGGTRVFGGLLWSGGWSGAFDRRGRCLGRDDRAAADVGVDALRAQPSKGRTHSSASSRPRRAPSRLR